MAEENKREAAEKMGRAGRQMRHAAHNVTDAAEAGTEYIKDEVTDAAERSYEGVKELAEKMIKTEMGRGVGSLVVGVVLIGFGVKKLSNAREIRKHLADNLSKAEHHIRPNG